MTMNPATAGALELVIPAHDPKAGQPLPKATDGDNAEATKEARDKALRKHESAIRSGQLSFYSMGKALRAIRDEGLMPSQFKSIESYAKKTFDISKSTVSRLISAARFMDTLIGLEGEQAFKILPTSESQVRPVVVSDIPEDQWIATWKKVVEAIDPKKKKVTAALVASVVKEVLPKPTPKTPTPVEQKPNLELIANLVKEVRAKPPKTPAKIYKECLEKIWGELEKRSALNK